MSIDKIIAIILGIILIGATYWFFLMHKDEQTSEEKQHEHQH